MITAPDWEPLDGYVPPPYIPPATVDERIVKAWREVTRTPGRAALATAAICGVGAFLVALRTVPVATADAGGPLRARCGITFYVAGASNRAVDTACRYAFAPRIPDLLVLATLSVGAIALLVLRIARPGPPGVASRLRRCWDAVTSTPARAAVATFDVVALMTVLVASQPVGVTTADATSPLRARCGLQYEIFGAANAAVRASCRRAYGARAWVFFIALAVLVVGVASLATLVGGARTRVRRARPQHR